MTTNAWADLIIDYDASNRPLTVTGLSVPSFLVVDITFDYSGKTFNDQYDSGTPPAGPPGGIIWGDQPLALATANALRDAMNVDSQANSLALVDAFFPSAVDNSNLFNLVDLNANPNGPWRVAIFSSFPRDAAFPSSFGWATVSATVPEPSAFLCIGIVGLIVFGWKNKSRIARLK
jgi:hypothetical protein